MMIFVEKYVSHKACLLNPNSHLEGAIFKKQTSEFNSNQYHTVGDFHRHALNWSFPNKNLTEVCYGGVFVVSASRVLFLSNHQPRERQALKLIEEILGRDASISLEEHFCGTNVGRPSCTTTE